MTANATEGMAKIIQFPVGGRAGLSGGRYGAHVSEQPAWAGVAKVAYGGASYHEAAIVEETREHDSHS